MYICVLGTLFFVYATIFHFTDVGFLGLALTVVFIICIVYLLYEIGGSIFGVIKITDEYVQYNLSFLPLVKIRFDELDLYPQTKANNTPIINNMEIGIVNAI